MNPFNTPGFSQFTSQQSNLLSIQLSSGESFPAICLRDEDHPLLGSSSLIYTPICMSGPFKIEPGGDFDEIEKQINKLSAGFIQTRQLINEPFYAGFQQEKDWFYHQDVRTNYVVPFGLDEDTFLQSMKRDSRARVKKLLSERDSFELKKTSEKQDVEFFSNLYENNANRLKFSPAYRFNTKNWTSLLNEDMWNLYILYYQGKAVAGCVTADYEDGIDYTFMAYQVSKMDFSRAMILYLYLHLSEHCMGDFSMGGGITEGDALATFKLSMGAVAQPLLRLKFINLSILRNKVSLSELKQAMLKRWP